MCTTFIFAFGQDLVRYAYNSVGYNAGRCCEFCSGPGFIGFALLAAGVCDFMVLADVHPRALDAVAATLDHPANAWVRNATARRVAARRSPEEESRARRKHRSRGDFARPRYLRRRRE